VEGLRRKHRLIMGWWKVLSLLVLIGCVYAADPVINLTDETHDDFLKEHELVIVDYFASWCGWSKKLAPQFKSAAIQAASELAKPVHFTKVDCANKTLNSKTCKKQGIRGFPTVFPFRNGKREAEILVGPSAKSILLNYARKMHRDEVLQFDQAPSAASSTHKCLLKDEMKWRKINKAG